jgi:hypothetical protein
MELFSLLAKLTLDSKEFDKGLSEAQRDADNFEMPETPSLDLDASDFESEISEAEAAGTGFGKSMEGVFDGIKTALTVTGIVAAITGIVNGIKEAVNLTAETADGIDKGSKRLNISRQAYQEWDHALRQSGASITDLQKGVIQFNKFIAENQPGAVVKDADEALGETGNDMAQAFARLKIDVKDANGQLKSTEQLINESLIALAGFEGSKEERGTLVTQLFGKGGNNLNALLDEGVDGVKALLSEAGDLGLIMSDEEITNAVAYGDAVANLNAELDAIKQAFVESIIPVLTDCVTWLTDFLTKLNPRLQTNSVYQIFDQIDQKTRKASRQVDESTVTAKKLIEDLQAMGDYWSLDEQGRMTWDALAAKALELFPQLSDYIDTDGHKISDNTDEIEKNIDAWARLEKQRLLSAAMDEKSEAVAKQLTAAYEKGADAAEKEAEAEGKRSTIMNGLNELLDSTDKKYSRLQNEFQSRFRASNITDENFADAEAWFEHNYRPFMQEANLAGTAEEWRTLNNEAESLRSTATEMITEAEEAQSKLKEYEKTLSDQMGLTNADVIKTKDNVSNYVDELNKVPTDVYTTFHTEYDDRGYDHSYAIGSSYIPYDQMALLHRGEKVLTATDVRRGTGDGIDYTRLEDSIVASIRAGMADAQVTAVVTDRQVAKGSNRFNGNEIDAGRFRP